MFAQQDPDNKACCFEVKSTVDWKPTTAAAKSVAKLFQATAYPILKADAATYRCYTDDMLNKMPGVEKVDGGKMSYTFKPVDGLTLSAVCSGAKVVYGGVVAGVLAAWTASF